MALPKYVNLLTFEPWKNNQVLIRFEHILEKSEATNSTSNITFNLHDVFLTLDIIDFRETTLAANQWINEASRYTFREDEDDYLPPNFEIEEAADIAMRRLRTRVGNKRIRQYDEHEFIENREKNADDVDFIISLKPMEIRTFVIGLGWKP